MPSDGTQRGDEDRELDPLLERALARLREVIGKGPGKVSQSHVARRSGLTQGHISKAINGLLPEVSFFVVAKIALGAGVSLDFLVQAPPAPRQFPPEDPPPDSNARPSDPHNLPAKSASRK